MNDFITILAIGLLLIASALLAYGRSRKYHGAFYYSVYGLSDCGQIRKKNEDDFLVANQGFLTFVAVADGMGGKDHGDLASLRAIEVLKKELNDLKGQGQRYWDKWLLQTTQRANWEIIKQAKKLKGRGTIGTTMVSAVMTGSKAFFSNVGDSRAYLLRNHNLRQITKDHSMVSLLVEKELIQPEDVYSHPRRGEIMRFLGQNDEIPVDLYTIDLEPADVILLCSDGLWEMVRDLEIKAIIEENQNPEDACKKLIAAANKAGGTDNITAVVVNVRQGK